MRSIITSLLKRKLFERENLSRDLLLEKFRNCNLNFGMILKIVIFCSIKFCLRLDMFEHYLIKAGTLNEDNNRYDSLIPTKFVPSEYIRVKKSVSRDIICCERLRIIYNAALET